MSNEGSDEGYLSEEFDSEEVAMICHDDRPRASASKTPLHLPVSELPVPRKTNTWNIFKEASVNEKTLSFNDNCLKVAYYKGSGAPSLGKLGGFTMYASPRLKFPADEATLTYETYFDPNFDWKKGGKLGWGLFFGEPGASGGNHTDSAASFRLMWRSKGDLECYVYRPSGVQQHPDYEKTTNFVGNAQYGDSVFRGCFRASKGKWTSIAMYAKTNTFDKESGSPLFDGVLRLTVDGTTHEYTKMIWRTKRNTQISGICGASFFGGSTSLWATPKDTYILHRNVIVT